MRGSVLRQDNAGGTCGPVLRVRLRCGICTRRVANFAGILLGYTETDVCNQLLIGKLSPRSTQYDLSTRLKISMFLLFLRQHLPRKIDELRHTIRRNLTGLFLCILCTPLAFTDESTGRRFHPSTSYSSVPIKPERAHSAGSSGVGGVRRYLQIRPLAEDALYIGIFMQSTS